VLEISEKGETSMAKKKKKSGPAKPTAPAAYTPQTYASVYQPQIDEAMNKVTNWNYDPMQDANYQALAKVYGARGNTAAKNSMADAAALNGGYGTSYAVSAAQQARNQYNQELASLIPDLEANAYNRAQTTLQAYRDADDTAYGRFRDTEGDRQWNWTNSYNAYRDAMSDYQWTLNYNLSKKSSAGSGGSGGGGGRRSSGGGGGYTSGGSTVSGNPYGDLYDNASDKKVSMVHVWDKKNKKILDKTITKEIKKYNGKGR
jgi:hypothetical protein